MNPSEKARSLDNLEELEENLFLVEDHPSREADSIFIDLRDQEFSMYGYKTTPDGRGTEPVHEIGHTDATKKVEAEYRAKGSKKLEEFADTSGDQQ